MVVITKIKDTLHKYSKDKLIWLAFALGVLSYFMWDKGN